MIEIKIGKSTIIIDVPDDAVSIKIEAEGNSVRVVDGDKNIKTSGDINIRDAMADGDICIMVGDDGVILRSENGGKLWIEVDNPFGQYNINAISNIKGEYIAVGDHGRIAKSIDRGLTWEPMNTIFIDGDVFDIANIDGEPVAVGANGQIIILKNNTEDVSSPFCMSTSGEFNGQHWVPIVNPLIHSHLYSICSTKYAAIAVGSRGRLARSNDNGKTWYVKNNPFGYEEYIGLSGVSKSNIILAGPYGKMGISTDNGLSWEIIDTHLDTETINYIGDVGEFTIAIGSTGLMGRSNDNGVTWEALKNPFKGDVIIKIIKTTTEFLAVGSKGSIWHSTDDGLTWDL